MKGKPRLKITKQGAIVGDLINAAMDRLNEAGISYVVLMDGMETSFYTSMPVRHAEAMIEDMAERTRMARDKKFDQQTEGN